MAKSFLRKIPFNQLTGCSGTSTSPIPFFPLLCLWEAMWAVGIVPGVFAGEPGPCHCNDGGAAAAESRLEAIPCITPRSVRERTLIIIRGLEDLAF